MKIEDRGWKIEDRGSMDEQSSALDLPSSSLDLQSSNIIAKRKRVRWRDKYREAFRGMKLGIRGHSSFFVHFFFAALVVMAATVLRCEPLEWCLLLGCIGLVLTAELFNSAVETIYWGLDDLTKPRVRNCLDIAAGAVLLASITAAIIGCMVFLPKVAAILVHLIS
jgi:diacylglycerol kinase